MSGIFLPLRFHRAKFRTALDEEAFAFDLVAKFILSGEVEHVFRWQPPFTHLQKFSISMGEHIRLQDMPVGIADKYQHPAIAGDLIVKKACVLACSV